MKRPAVLAVLTVVVLYLLAIAIPNYLPPRVVSAKNACVVNLEFIERRKIEWAAKTNRKADSIPTAEELFGTNGLICLCPAGGTYHIGALNQKPTCSLGPPNHVLK